MKRRWRWILLLCLILMIPVSASANSPGPAPRVDYTLKILNAPDVEFSITILTREPGAEQSAFMKDEHPEHREMIAAMFSLKAEGWYPVSEGPSGGLFQSPGTTEIEWMRVSQPMKEYRIILVTQDGTVQVTDSVTRRDYANKGSYDVSSNQLTQIIDYWEYGKRILIAVVTTLTVELLLLKEYKLLNSKNIRIVIVTNLITQAGFNLILFVTHYYEYSSQNLSLLLLLEAGIFVIEATIYALSIKDNTVPKRIEYAFVANLLSFIVGLFIYAITMAPFVFLWLAIVGGIGLLIRRLYIRKYRNDPLY